MLPLHSLHKATRGMGVYPAGCFPFQEKAAPGRKRLPAELLPHPSRPPSQPPETEKGHQGRDSSRDAAHCCPSPPGPIAGGAAESAQIGSGGGRVKRQLRLAALNGSPAARLPNAAQPPSLPGRFPSPSAEGPRAELPFPAGTREAPEPRRRLGAGGLGNEPPAAARESRGTSPPLSYLSGQAAAGNFPSAHPWLPRSRRAEGARRAAPRRKPEPEQGRGGAAGRRGGRRLGEAGGQRRGGQGARRLDRSLIGREGGRAGCCCSCRRRLCLMGRCPPPFRDCDGRSAADASLHLASRRRPKRSREPQLR